MPMPQTDLFGETRTTLPPPNRWYPLRVVGIEPMKSRRGMMWRLVAEIRAGEFRGVRVYKPLTFDLRGAMWLLDQMRLVGAALEAGVAFGSEAYFRLRAACLAEVTGLEGRVYHYEHPEGVFVTVSKLRRTP